MKHTVTIKFNLYCYVTPSNLYCYVTPSSIYCFSSSNSRS